MHFPFRLKIFGLAMVLLLLLAVVSWLSISRIKQVNSEIAELADAKIPFTDQLHNMVVHVLEQELQLERMLRGYGTEPRDRAELQQMLTLFEELGARFDREMLAAIRLAKHGFEFSVSETDKIEFTKIDLLLSNIHNKHTIFHRRALEMSHLLQAGNQDKANELRDVITQDKEEFNTEINKTRSLLDNFVNMSVQQAEKHEEHVLYLNIFTTLGATALGLCFAAIITTGLTKPIRRLLDGTKAIEHGTLDVTVPVTSRDEIGTLTAAFNTMTRELRVKERIKATFGKYLDSRIVEDLLRQPDLVDVGGEKRVMTILFIDMAKFTTLSEQLAPQTLVGVINQYLTLMSEPIRQHDGVIDKYIGDAVMAFWGPPFTRAEEHAKLACFAALEQLAKLAMLRQMLPDLLGLRTTLPPIDMRIGVATGEVVVGNIGSDVTKSYTVLGDTVNLAARLESANKQYGTRLLLSETTQHMALDAIETRELDSIQVVGKSTPVRIFELLARKGELDPALANMRNRFEQGLEAYRRGVWEEAQGLFQACLALDPHDMPSRVFLERLQHLQAQPPADDWDGVWRLTQK